MASELPLVLYDCGYESVKWIYEPGTHLRLLQTMTALWTEKTMAYGPWCLRTFAPPDAIRQGLVRNTGPLLFAA
eukprot:m.595766 g.595766  ORF g.595766 m.595766 type:complete len:74 (-) comp58043_c0_seq10:353-574(-)